MDTDVGEHWKEPSFKVLVSESTGDTRGMIWKLFELDSDHGRKKSEAFGGFSL